MYTSTRKIREKEDKISRILDALTCFFVVVCYNLVDQSGQRRLKFLIFNIFVLQPLPKVG